jgi:hypothetical protein
MPKSGRNLLPCFSARQIVELTEFSLMNDKKYFVQDVVAGHQCESEH